MNGQITTRQAAHEYTPPPPPPLHGTRRTSHGAPRLVQAMSTWSVKTRRAPSWPRWNTTIYGLIKTTAIHGNEYYPHPSPSKGWRCLLLRLERAATVFGRAATAMHNDEPSLPPPSPFPFPPPPSPANAQRKDGRHPHPGVPDRHAQRGRGDRRKWQAAERLFRPRRRRHVRLQADEGAQCGCRGAK